MNNDVYDLGEINIFEEAFREYKNSNEDLNFAEIYWGKINKITDLNITTNKFLYNYQYSGIISQHIPNAKIIHCFRNPLIIFFPFIEHIMRKAMNIFPQLTVQMFT